MRYQVIRAGIDAAGLGHVEGLRAAKPRHALGHKVLHARDLIGYQCHVRRMVESDLHTKSALRDLDGRRRIERAEFVGIAGRYAAHHTIVIDGVLTEPPQWG